MSLGITVGFQRSFVRKRAMMHGLLDRLVEQTRLREGASKLVNAALTPNAAHSPVSSVSIQSVGQALQREGTPRGNTAAAKLTEISLTLEIDDGGSDPMIIDGRRMGQRWYEPVRRWRSNRPVHRILEGIRTGNRQRTGGRGRRGWIGRGGRGS
jgi:hypothetical protein